jgi:hypothetical protein
VDEYGHDPTAASIASARYASPKASYTSESYYESASSSWYSAATTGAAYAPPHATTYHNAAHSSLLGPHGHEQHYTMPNIGHNEPNLSQQVKMSLDDCSSSMYFFFFLESQSNTSTYEFIPRQC